MPWNFFIFQQYVTFVTKSLCIHFPFHLTAVILVSKVPHNLSGKDMTETVIPDLKDRLQCYLATASNQILALGMGKKLTLTFSWSIVYSVVYQQKETMSKNQYPIRYAPAIYWPLKTKLMWLTIFVIKNRRKQHIIKEQMKGVEY